MKTKNFGCLIVLCVVLLSSVGCGPKSAPETDAQASSSTEAETKTMAAEEDAEADVEATVELPLLSEKLNEFSMKAKEMMPAEVMQTFKEGIEEVRGTGIEESALQVGAQAIDAELPDATGNQVKLSELWAKGPVVVTWYRGGWCPYCNLQLAAMQGALPAIKAAGASLVAITPETPDNSLSTSEKNKLEFAVLSDTGNKVAKQYGVVFKLPSKVSPIYKNMFKIDLEKSNGNTSDELPLAATYVIDTEGVIRYAFLDADYTKRAEPSAVLEALNQL